MNYILGTKDAAENKRKICVWLKTYFNLKEPESHLCNVYTDLTMLHCGLMPKSQARYLEILLYRADKLVTARIYHEIDLEPNPSIPIPRNIMGRATPEGNVIDC